PARTRVGEATSVTVGRGTLTVAVLPRSVVWPQIACRAATLASARSGPTGTSTVAAPASAEARQRPSTYTSTRAPGTTLCTVTAVARVVNGVRTVGGETVPSEPTGCAGDGSLVRPQASCTAVISSRAMSKGAT